MDTQRNRFSLAPMSPLLAVSTRALVAMLVAVPAAVVFFAPPRLAAWFVPLFVILVGSMLLLIWGLYRPRWFVVEQDALEIIWPWRRRRLTRADILVVRAVSKASVGRLVRLFGAGGFLGAFGLFHSQHLGQVDAFFTRRDGMILIQGAGGRPLLISPERPEEFVEAMRAMLAPAVES